VRGGVRSKGGRDEWKAEKSFQAEARKRRPMTEAKGQGGGSRRRRTARGWEGGAAESWSAVETAKCSARRIRGGRPRRQSLTTLYLVERIQVEAWA